MMTIDNFKKLDKCLRQIQDPFGTGFPALQKLVDEWSMESGLSVHDLICQYIAWKWRK